MKKPRDLVSWNTNESDRNLKKPKHTSNPKRTKFWDDIPLSPIQDHNNKNYINSIDETKLKETDDFLNEFEMKEKSLKSEEDLFLEDDFFETSDILDTKLFSKLDNDTDFSVCVEGSNKFTVTMIRTFDTYKILYGNETRVAVMGSWANLNYTMGLRVCLIKCKCCLDKSIIPDKIPDDLPEDINIKHRYFIDDNHNYLMIQDDVITTSNFLLSLTCINRPLISRRLYDFNFNFIGSEMIVGIAVHYLLEMCIEQKDFTLPFIRNEIKKFTSNHLTDLYDSNITEDAFRNSVCKHIGALFILKDKIKNIKLAEYSLHSLNFGVRGKIDCLTDIHVIELKTGKIERPEHRAQVLMYSLMLAEDNKDKTSLFIPIIYYTLTKNIVNVPIRHNEMKDLIIKRNLVALQSHITPCKCSFLESCGIYTKILKLNEKHWLRRQLDILENEFETPSYYDVSKIDEKVVEDRQQIALKLSDEVEEIQLGKIDEILSINSTNNKFICSGRVVSNNNNQLYIEVFDNLNLESSLKISSDNNLLYYKTCMYSLLYVAYQMYACKSKPFFLPGQENGLDYCEDIVLTYKLNETFSDSIDFSKINVSNNDSLIDKGDNIKENSSMKNNMLYFINNVKPGDIKYKDTLYYTLINSVAQSLPKSIPIPNMYKTDFLKLNGDQQKALLSALNCEYYKAIHGLPGTGKSTLISLLIKILVFYRKKILLVCFTRMAGDHLIKKLNNRVNFHRAKNYDNKNNPSEKNFKSVKEIKEFYDSVDLVVSTCYSFKDSIFKERKFDYCIIDEGSQIDLLLACIPISRAEKFIVVGDHLQINPIRGSNISVFEHLLTRDPNHVKLKTQYRMGPEIMKLSNYLFYDNMMLCGDSVNFKGTVKFIDSCDIELSNLIKNLKDNFVILCYFNSVVQQIQPLTNNRVITIDKFQGSEFDNIIVIFDPVVGNNCQKCPKRLNVALTRARKTCILYGNYQKMINVDIFKQLLDLINK